MELEEAVKKLKTLNQEKYDQDTILSLYSNFIDEDEENQPYILTPFERDAIEVVLNHLTKQEKMIAEIKSKLEEHIQHCRQEAQSSLHNEICRISLRFDESLLNIIEKKSEESE